MTAKPKRPILNTVEQSEQSLVYPFTEEEYCKEIATLNDNKAAGIDDVLLEQLKHLGPREHRWLHSMLNTCFIEYKIPKVWRQSRIIVYTYKLYERLILNRIIPTVESHLIKEQSGFGHGK